MDIVSEGTRTCSKCGIEKNIAEFDRQKNRRGVYVPRGHCKACRKEYSQAYYLVNKEKIISAFSKWQKKNRARVNAYQRDRREKKSSLRLQEFPEKYLDSPRIKVDALIKQLKVWTPEKARASVNNKRSHLLGDSSRIDEFDILRAFRSQKFRCYWCKILLADDYHLDHKVPVSRGGKNTSENIVLSCPACNKTKWANSAKKLKKIVRQ